MAFFCAKKGENMKKLTTSMLVKQALISAVYFTLTITLSNFSYGPVQFRYTEVLNLLAFFNPIHSIGVTVGVFLANLLSPFGLYDVIFGTLHTAISLFFISKSKNIIIASLWPMVFSFIIGFELSTLAGIGAFIPMTGSVMLSEFIIMSILAVPLFKILEKNPAFLKAIEANQNIMKTY